LPEHPDTFDKLDDLINNMSSALNRISRDVDSMGRLLYRIDELNKEAHREQNRLAMALRYDKKNP
jgi:hypothetical protein